MIQIFLPIILSIMALLFQWDSGIQPAKITKKWFPDPEIAITTPALNKKSGYTNHAELMAFVEKIREKHADVMRIEWIGTSQKGKQIPVIRIKSNPQAPLKVWMQGGLHGDEPASTEGLLYLLTQIFEPQHADLLKHFDWAIVPMANIDGSEKHNRYAANGLDLNRDQTKLMIQESVYLKQALCAFEPDLALDFHEFRPYRMDFLEMGTAGLGTAYDVMILNSSNLNVPQNQRELTQKHFVDPLKTQLSELQFRSHDYYSTQTEFDHVYLSQGSSSARSSATNFALTGAIATLFEVRGVGIGRTSLKRRTYITYLCAMSYLNSAMQNSDKVLEALHNPSITDKVVISTTNKRFDQSILMVDLHTKDTLSIVVPTKDAKRMKIKEARKMPEYYLVHPDAAAILQRLNWFHLNCDTLKMPENITVEQYTQTDACNIAANKYEGVFRQNCNYKTETQSVQFPKGTLKFPINQRKGRILSELLEPDAPNSLMSFHVLDANKYPVLPYYRLMN